jgi:hypothetical protein
MGKILSDLYSGNIFPAENIGNDSKEAKVLSKELSILFDKLKVTLGENYELLSCYEETSSMLNAIHQEAFFVEGFKLGMKIAAEAMCN